MLGTTAGLFGAALWPRGLQASHKAMRLKQSVSRWPYSAIPLDEPNKDLNVETEKHDKELAEIMQNLKRMVEQGQ